MSKAFDFLVFIGRFQPFHLGHRHVVKQALGQSKHVIVLVGSANLARSVRNPFTYDEREQMIRATFRKDVADGRLIIRPLDDVSYNDSAWIALVQKTVDALVLETGNDGGTTLHGTVDFRIGLVGFGRDRSSYYLKLFPEWGHCDVGGEFSAFTATQIRADFLRSAPILPRDSCPPEVVGFLSEFRLGDRFADLVREAAFIDEYKARWASAPYPPTFVTVDAVVVQAGHVLLVRRGEQPGKGLLALPGGFVDAEETLRDAVIRELREETHIADNKGPIPPAMLGSFVEDAETRVFDEPHRSARGRTITHAFLFRCPQRETIFTVRGGDDAASAAWHRLGDLKPGEFFEDHWFILQAMVGL